MSCTNWMCPLIKMKGLVLGVYTESSENCNKITSYSSCFKEVDKKYNGQLTQVLNKTGPFYKPAKQKLLWLSLINETSSDSGFDCVSVVDLGSKDAKDKPLEGVDQKAENIRCAIADGVKALRSCSNFDSIYLDPCENAQCVAEAANLVLHCYDQLKQKPSKPKSQLHLYKFDNMQPSTEESFEKGRILAESQNFARLLMETPANHMTPSIFASTVAEKFKDSQVKVVVREKEWMESMKMGSFLSVARGSDEPPKFVEIHYDGLPGTEENVALVGKGVTFDAGGISLKPSSNMDKMRADMGGAACVVATILAASSLNMKINIKGFIPLTENLPSGKATKPGDVVFAMNGKSIQVDNTDAEGRLILADALCYAQKFNPKAIVDVATLTGAMMIALGAGASGVFSNDNDLWKILEKASYVSGDRVWRMPLYRLYTKQVTETALADLNNISGTRNAGSCTAAAFLQEFITSDTKWMHVDIAGVMENKDEVSYLSPGMSGRPTRTFVQFLQFLADK